MNFIPYEIFSSLSICSLREFKFCRTWRLLGSLPRSIRRIRICWGQIWQMCHGFLYKWKVTQWTIFLSLSITASHSMDLMVYMIRAELRNKSHGRPFTILIHVMIRLNGVMVIPSIVKEWGTLWTNSTKKSGRNPIHKLAQHPSHGVLFLL